jgi:pimeloyl-ACP methyl ester carboxylesterase
MSTTPQIKIAKSTDGTDIWSYSIGDSQNPALVFIHGTGLSADVFERIASDKTLLSHNFVVCYDLRGHGRSGKPAGSTHTSSSWAADFTAVCSAHGLSGDRKPLLVGWSLGGVVAADVCALDSIPIRGIVYLAGLPYVGPIMGVIGTEVIQGFVPGLLTTDNVQLSKQTSRDFFDSCFTRPEEVPFEIKCRWVGMSALVDVETVGTVLSRYQDPEALFKAAGQGLPTLIISGTEDKQISGERTVAELQPKFTKLQVKYISGGGHAVFWEYQKECVDALVQFSKEVFT